jgi:hypothetical protein
MPGCCCWRELVLLHLCQPTAEEERKMVRWVWGIVTNLSKLTYTHTGREREHDEVREQQQKGSSPEPGSEELGRARPNGGVTYPGADEVSKRPPVSDEPLVVPTSPSESKPTLLLEVARRTTSEVVVVVALV